MNPFNQARYRGEHQLGNVYQDVRYIIDNIETLQKISENLDKLRSGNIRLKQEGRVLFWGYTESEEWYELGQLAITDDIDGIQSQIDTINSTLDNQNSLITVLQNTQTNHGTRLEDLEQEAAKISVLENFKTTANQNIQDNHNLIQALTLRVEALEGEEVEG